jgi:hypothetical protein
VLRSARSRPSIIKVALRLGADFQPSRATCSFRRLIIVIRGLLFGRQQRQYQELHAVCPEWRLRPRNRELDCTARSITD